MNVEINWTAVLLAFVFSMLLAKTWYAESVFGGVWRRLTGVTPADSKRAGSKPILLTLFANVVTAIVLAGMVHVDSVFFNDSSVWRALLVGFAAWLAFSATTLLTHNAFEQKADKLTLINNGYQLVLFVGMATIIGLVGA